MADNNYLDQNGVLYLWQKIVAKITNMIANKVDKVDGKGLSTNDYTTAEKTKLTGIAEGANKYAHPTSSGNKHIPAGGSSGQILRWSSEGTAVWGADSNTTYSDFKGATDSASGAHGLVPAPSTGDNEAFLSGSGDWKRLDLILGVNPEKHKMIIGLGNNTSSNILMHTSVELPTADASIPGLMSHTDKTKLDDLPTNATLSSTYAKKSDITGVYKYRGSVATEDKLPTSGQTTGDVYDIVAASSYGAAGMNVAWNGKAWDALGEKFQISAITNTWMDTNLT